MNEAALVLAPERHPADRAQLGHAARGLPLADSARPFAALAALATIYSLLATLRLRSIAKLDASIASATPVSPTNSTPLGIPGAFITELRRILGVRGAFIMLVIAPVVYGIYYPQPYLNQILRKTPIVVVDNDLSELSRNIVQTLDASGAVKVAARAETLEGCGDLMAQSFARPGPFLIELLV